MSIQVGVIGAGLSGLACALELEKAGIDVTVFEKSNQAGGRVKTDEFEGFKLDHGFQVYLSSYEVGSYFFDYKKLQLGSFSPGAILVEKNIKSLMSDPIRQPTKLFQTLFNPNLTIKDKLLILKLKKMSSDSKNIDANLNQKTTLEFLVQYGFSNKAIKKFFQPFFAGVFLDLDLKTPAGFFVYIFGKFGSGLAGLPKAGMQELALQMQRRLKRNIIFSHEAQQVTKNDVSFQGDIKYSFDYVVVALDNSSALKLISQSEPKWNSVTTLYFKTKSSDAVSKYLYLNTAQNNVVNHVACLTAVQPSYAPDGWHLYSVNCVGVDLSTEKDVLTVMNDLRKIFGDVEVNKWDFIKSYYIKKALPSKTQYGKENINKNGIYYCGDYLESPSIQGALLSGYNVANTILKIR